MTRKQLFMLCCASVGGVLLCLTLDTVEPTSSYHFTIKQTDTVSTPIRQEEVAHTPPPPSAPCGAVSKAHKHLLDDWILALQSQQQLGSWQQSLKALPHCLQDVAHSYMLYKQALTHIDENLTIEERFDLLSSLQTEYFSQLVIKAWFSEENSWHAHALTRWHILSDKSLGKNERDALLSAHISQLPEEQHHTIEAAQAFLQLQQHWHSMDYNDFSASFGNEAARRLVQAQQDQQKWQLRVDNYIHKYKAIKETTPVALQSQKMDTLKQSLFNVHEQKRLNVVMANESLY
ncbi:lipase secretion chaperone [Pseudoalteromonas obscura]|uniref:Lipase chaperone n=1 Tax=Pseudoalteromonas obscura TaxID=3048491 RepID=A0ABT7EKC1_9GAMM|nr:lipase secretion chaperone [Pseudoalteromonas sp. P94(2023)]MDK2595463.1 lipase secretion chaperone [Pseudoalteromonas sp. P94(2023)]